MGGKKIKKKNNPQPSVVKKTKTILKRKQQRQEKRKAKKNAKVDFLKKKYSNPGRNIIAEDDEEIPSSDEEVNMPIKLEKKGNTLSTETAVQATISVNKKTEKEMKELGRQQKKQRRKQLKLANEEEQITIAKLEKQLGLKKRKSKNLPKSFEEDGLSYILNVCDPSKIEALGDLSEDEEQESKKMKFNDDSSEDDDDNEELDKLLGISEGVDNSTSDHSNDEGSDIGSDNESDIGCDNESDIGSNNDNDSGSDNEEGLSSDNKSDNEGAQLGSDDNIEGEFDKVVNSEVWEDIYGRKRDGQGHIIKESPEDQPVDKTDKDIGITSGKYVPPAMRRKALETNQSEEKRLQLARLSKQMKGLLNRLAESNMAGICKQLESFYMEHSRNDVNKTLTDLLTSSLISPVLTPDRLVMEHVMLVAVLHANVGTEVGAHILQYLVKMFSETYIATDLFVEESKTLDNILLIVSYIHAFKIVDSKLVFEILHQLSDSFKPKDIELILVTLKNCGFVLRKENPGELKNLILKIQTQVSASKEEDSRIMFMMEVLLAIKNNNVNKIPNYDPSHFEHLKKTLRTFLREGNFVTEMKIGYNDLIQAESKGRWWIVGSAFAGNLVGETEESEDQKQKITTPQFSSKLLDLARQMRMNTETRRQIFCLLMTAEDFMDATEKLVKLGTKNQTEREVSFVVTDCCVQEKEFNPYYVHLATKLANVDRKYRVATQFTIWDKLKQMAEMKKLHQSNLAKFTASLIKDKSQSLGVLKVIEFAEMNKHYVRFLREVLLSIVLEPIKDEDVISTFQSVSESSKLSLFRESLRLFLHHFLLKQTSKLPAGTDLTVLQRRVKISETALLSSSSKLKM